MTKEQREQCHKIIYTAATSAAAMGAGLAQLPSADGATILPINISMIMALGKVFDQDLTKETATAMALAVSPLFVGRMASPVLFGWIPILGNVVNASTAAGMTEALGWMIANRFEQESKIDPAVLRRAEETFGRERALEWLKGQCEALSNLRPIDLLETASGRRQVLDVLVCIDHGYVY